jgi:hypothetical protein
LTEDHRVKVFDTGRLLKQLTPNDTKTGG